MPLDKKYPELIPFQQGLGSLNLMEIVLYAIWQGVPQAHAFKARALGKNIVYALFRENLISSATYTVSYSSKEGPQSLGFVNTSLY